MADISMCANQQCPLKDQCYRQTARVSDHQSYAAFKFTVIDGKVQCLDFCTRGNEEPPEGGSK